MPILCPNCKTHAFETVHLDDTLEAERCGSCQGIWISSARYFSYLDSRRDETPPPAGSAPEVAIAEADSRSLKLCPACGKFMRYYPVGHGIPFGTDKCNTCGGIWLNKGEWELLHGRNLHRKLHVFSSDAWQEEVRQQIRRATERASLLRRLGPDDVNELDRVTAWIEAHPHRDVLISYLQQHLRAQSPLGNP